MSKKSTAMQFPEKKPAPLGLRAKKVFEGQWQLMVMSIPFLILVIIFNYVPLWGWSMAFQKYKPNLPFSKQKWVGFENFKTLFLIDDFGRVIKNTLAMSTINLVLNTVGAILLALS